MRPSCLTVVTLVLAPYLFAAETAVTTAVLAGQAGWLLDGQLGFEIGETVGVTLGLLLFAAILLVWFLPSPAFLNLFKKPPPISPKRVVNLVAFLCLTCGGMLWLLLSDRPAVIEVDPVGNIVVSQAGRPLVLTNLDGKVHIHVGGDNIRVAEQKELDCRELPLDRLTCAVLSTDGAQLLSGGKDGSVRLWDLASGTEMVRCEGHRNPITCLAFSADGRRAVSGSKDWTVRVWDLASGRQVCVCRGHRDVISVAFSADGSMAVSRSDDGTVRVWQLPE
jgi:WD40 repeat protein